MCKLCLKLVEILFLLSLPWIVKPCTDLSAIKSAALQEWKTQWLPAVARFYLPHIYYLLHFISKSLLKTPLYSIRSPHTHPLDIILWPLTCCCLHAGNSNSNPSTETWLPNTNTAWSIHRHKVETHRGHSYIKEQNRHLQRKQWNFFSPKNTQHTVKTHAAPPPVTLTFRALAGLVSSKSLRF